MRVADQHAQAVDGQAQLFALGLVHGARFLKLGKLAFGDQIDRAEPARATAFSPSMVADSAVASPISCSMKPSFSGSNGGGHSNRSPAIRAISARRAS